MAHDSTPHADPADELIAELVSLQGGDEFEAAPVVANWRPREDGDCDPLEVIGAPTDGPSDAEADALLEQAIEELQKRNGTPSA